MGEEVLSGRTASGGVAAPLDDAPRIERVLARLRVPAIVPAVVGTTPSLALPWLGAAAALTLLAAVASLAEPTSSARATLILVLAPVIPLAGVAAAYGPWADPMFETVRSTPTSGFGVLLARTIAVVATCLPMLFLLGLVTPTVGVAATAWLLPTVALALSALVVSTVTSLVRATVVVTGLWFASVVTAGIVGNLRGLFGGTGQLVFLVLAISASLALVRRRERIEIEGFRARRALVESADTERRRIERNLHDGAQQHLVAIGVKAGLAAALVQKDPARAVAVIDELRRDAQEALEGLRDLTRGGYPPILADEGLEAALRLRAARAPVKVMIDAIDIGRCPEPIEIAVYFCCLEAMQNAAKYARAGSVDVVLRRTGDAIAFSVCDEGAGFDPSTVRRGVGMRSMADRLASVGGTFHVRSAVGRGTVVSGRVPLTAQPPSSA
jgi:signal transduction histidine kinase